MKGAASRTLLGVGLLSGGIIGAGVFSLPFAFSSAGLLVGFFYLAVAAVVYTVLHRMYADIIIQTPGSHRFVGYARRYLGRGAAFVAVLMGIVEMIFVLTIYLVLSKSFLNFLIPFGTTEQHIVLFWLLGSAAIFLKLRRLALSELLITISIVAIIAFIFLVGIFHIDRLALVPAIGPLRSWLLPLPAILFALSGRVVIPSVVELLGGKDAQRKDLKRVITLGTLLPVIVYGLFTLGAIGLSAPITEDAVTGFIGHISPLFLGFIGLLGFLSLWSSYILVGLDVNQTLRYDLKMGHFGRIFLVLLAPLLLYMVGFTSFLTLVSFVGGIFLSMEGFFIVWMYVRARKSKTSHSVARYPFAPLTIALIIIALGAALIAAFIG